MLSLVLALAVIGVVLYLIETIVPMDPTIKIIIRVIVLIGVLYYLAGLFGVADLPLPHYRGSR